MTFDIKNLSKTKLSLINAMDELLKAASLEDITIKVLVKQAHITRSTFYIHYPDKYALFQDLISYCYKNMYTQISIYPPVNHSKDHKENLKRNYLIILTEIHSNKHIFNQVNSRSRIEASIRGLSFIKPIFIKQLNQLNIARQINEDYFATFYLAGLFSNFERWIVNGFDLTPEEFAQQLTEITYPMLLSQK